MAMTPRLRSSSSSESNLLSAPRSLKEAVNCKFSNLRKISAPAIADSVRECRAGVISTAPLIALAAASISASVIGRKAFIGCPAASQVWRIRNSQVLGQSPGEFRIQGHTSNLLNLVWFSNLKFLNVNAMKIVGTANPPHEWKIGLL